MATVIKSVGRRTKFRPKDHELIHRILMIRLDWSACSACKGNARQSDQRLSRYSADSTHNFVNKHNSKRLGMRAAFECSNAVRCVITTQCIPDNGIVMAALAAATEEKTAIQLPRKVFEKCSRIGIIFREEEMGADELQNNFISVELELTFESFRMHWPRSIIDIVTNR